MTFSFREQLAKGEEAERFLDGYFDDRFKVLPVTREGQRKGIDRVFIDRQTHEHARVEYKTDWRAQATRNAFIETVSVDSQEKRGWAYTTQADLVFYYVPGEELVYVLQPAVIRQCLPAWQQRYRAAKARNEGYYTHGVLVPLHELERCAKEVISL